MRKFLSVRMNLDHSVVNNDSFNELFNFLAKITEKEENKKFEIDSQKVLDMLSFIPTDDLAFEDD